MGWHGHGVRSAIQTTCLSPLKRKPLASLTGCYYPYSVFFLYQDLEREMKGGAGPKTSLGVAILIHFFFFWASNWNLGENYILWFWCITVGPLTFKGC